MQDTAGFCDSFESHCSVTQKKEKRRFWEQSCFFFFVFFNQTKKPLQVLEDSYLSSSALWSGLAHSVGAEVWAYVYRFTYVRYYQSYTWVSIGHLVLRDLGQSLTTVFFTFNIEVSQQWEQRRGNSVRVVSHRCKNITFFFLYRT